MKQNNEVILVGEYHGSIESPVHFYNIICNSLSLTSKKIIVALELIDGDIQLDGNDENLLRDINKSAIWNSQHDGKTSVAMFDLIKKLNSLVNKNKLSVIFFDSEEEERDLNMAVRIKAHISSGSLIIALTGNRHNKIKHGNIWDPKSKNMGAYMREQHIQLASINLLANGGDVWICTNNCMKHSLQEIDLLDKDEVFLAGNKSSYQYHWKIGSVHSSEPKVY